MGGLARGPPQDPTIWPRLDLGDHAPHEQDDFTGAAPGSWQGEEGSYIKKLSLGETRKSARVRAFRGREEE